MSNNSNKNISISSLLSPHNSDTTNGISAGLARSPLANKDIVVLDHDNKLGHPSAMTSSAAPARKSTKVSLMSIMNDDPPLPAPVPSLPPQLKASSAPKLLLLPSSLSQRQKPLATNDQKSRPVKRSRLRKPLAALLPLLPLLDLNRTIIIDGKPVVIPAFAPAASSQHSTAPPKKRARTSTTASASSDVKKQSLHNNIKKPVQMKPKLPSGHHDIANHLRSSPSAKVIKRVPSKPTPGPASPSPLLKTSSTHSNSSTHSEPAPKPITTLDPPTLSEVKPIDAELSRLDPLALKKVHDKVAEEPIISLHIPLTDAEHPPGSAQVIFNVIKLCEDKYGWKAVHPGANFAMDELNEDDDMDDMEDDDEGLEDSGPSKNAPKEKEEEKPKKKELSFEARMNRKIGKYDYEDPFIDDEELLWDEHQVSTKDGFFVYYGPLFEEGQQPRIEKLDNRRGGSNGVTGGSGGASRPGITVNGRIVGNPHRGTNGRFTSARSPEANGGLDPKSSLVNIQPKLRAETPL